MKVERKPADFCVDRYRGDAISLFGSIVQGLSLSNRHLVEKASSVMHWAQPPYRLVGARGNVVLRVDIQQEGGSLLRVTVGGKEGIQSRLADRVHKICTGMEGVAIVGAKEFYRYSYSHSIYP